MNSPLSACRDYWHLNNNTLNPRANTANLAKKEKERDLDKLFSEFHTNCNINSWTCKRPKTLEKKITTCANSISENTPYINIRTCRSSMSEPSSFFQPFPVQHSVPCCRPKRPNEIVGHSAAYCYVYGAQVGAFNKNQETHPIDLHSND